MHTQDLAFLNGMPFERAYPVSLLLEYGRTADPDLLKRAQVAMDAGAGDKPEDMEMFSAMPYALAVTIKSISAGDGEHTVEDLIALLGPATKTTPTTDAPKRTRGPNASTLAKRAAEKAAADAAAAATDSDSVQAPVAPVQAPPAPEPVQEPAVPVAPIAAPEPSAPAPVQQTPAAPETSGKNDPAPDPQDNSSQRSQEAFNF